MKRLMFLVAVVAAMAFTSAKAEAAFEITFESNGNELTIVDNGLGDSNPTTNQITVDGDPSDGDADPLFFEGYSITGSVANAYMTPGGPNDPGISLGSTSITNTGATDALTVSVSANDYLFPTGPATLVSSASLTTTTANGSGTYEWDSFFCNNNVLYCTSEAFAPEINLAFAGPSSSGATTLSGPFFISGDYSLTSIANITMTLNNVALLTTGSARIIGAVPEPGSLALLGTGLFGLGFAARRRRRSL